MLRFCIVTLSLCLAASSAPAAPGQDTAPVKKAIEDFLRIQIKGLPGQATFEVGPLDTVNKFPSCPALEVSLPAGARAWGRTSVAVRCRT